MNFIIDFVKFVLQRVTYIPKTAVLPIPKEECCKITTHYLFGTVNQHATKALIDAKWHTFYSKHGWTETGYYNITKCFKPTDFCTDCNGLLDWYLGIDVNANHTYNHFCTDQEEISKSTRPYVIGEAVFRKSGSRMCHVGWIVGFDSDGEPLVAEARGLKEGVGVWRLCDRLPSGNKTGFTHRALMKKIFEYDIDPNPNWIKFEVTKPYHKGDEYKAMQKALNMANYKDERGKKLKEDGKWGPKSQFAFDTMLKNHS